MTGRLGASITQQLTEQITQNDDYVGEILTRELSWIQALIDGKLWRRIQLRKRVGSVTVISDASWSQTEDGVISGLCYWVFTGEEPAFGEVCALPESFVARLSDRSTQIMPAEMIASILPTLLHRGCLVLVFSIPRLDNSTFRYMTSDSRLAFTNSSARDPWISSIFERNPQRRQ